MEVKIMYGLISQDYLMHHGVKGMKWGVRHDPEKNGWMTEGEKKALQRKKKQSSDAFYSAWRKYEKKYGVNDMMNHPEVRELSNNFKKEQNNSEYKKLEKQLSIERQYNSLLNAKNTRWKNPELNLPDGEIVVNKYGHIAYKPSDPKYRKNKLKGYIAVKNFGEVKQLVRV